MADHPRIAAIKAATRKFETARVAVEQAIFDAYADPTVKRTEITDASPWTPGHTRKLARDHGIQADPAYQRRTETTRRRVAESLAEKPAPAEAQPGWLTKWPAVAQLSATEASDEAGKLALRRPDWFAEMRRDYEGDAHLVSYAMLVADAEDPEPSSAQVD